VSVRSTISSVPLLISLTRTLVSLRPFPFAEKEIQDWYHGFIDFEDKVSKIKTGILPKDTNLDYLTYNGADYEIKKSLLIVCQPLKDKITQECQDGTLYDKNVD